MKKQIRTLVLTAIAAVVLLGAYAILTLLLPKEEDPNKGKTFLIQDNPNNFAIATVEYPTDFDNNLAGYTYLVGQLPLEDGTGFVYEFYDNGKDDGYAYSQSMMKQAFTAMAALEYVELVEENADLAKYGLEDGGAVRVSLTPFAEDGVKKVLLIGNKYELGEVYYIRLEGQTTVYTCSSVAVDVYLSGSKALRDLNLVPSLGENYNLLQGVRMEKPDGERLAFRRLSSEEMSDTTQIIYTSFRLTEPYAAFANDNSVIEGFLTPLSQMIVLEVLEDRPADLSVYGLDKPYRIEMDLLDREEPLVFLFGTVSGNNTVYLMVEGTDTVYNATSFTSTFDFLNTQPMELRTGLVWLHAIRDVKEIVMDLPGGRHVLWLQDNIDQQTGEGTFAATLNGKEISEDNARRLFMSVISIAYDAELAENLPTTAPTHSFTVNYHNGRKSYLSLYKINNRQHAVRLENVPLDEVGFTVNITTLRQVEENVETILAGGDIKN